MTEMRNYHYQSKHPAQDAQAYLQHRIEEIVSQIKSASSAHHFFRHVVEIDELLRCDAPMGFTPSMVLAGIPDILFMLSKAVMQGYLLQPIKEDTKAARALSPVRRNPIAITNLKVKTAAAGTTEERGGGQVHRPTASYGNSVHSATGASATGSCSSNGSLGDVTSSANVFSFLPPLVRLPAFPPNASGALTVSEAAATAAATTSTKYENSQNALAVKQIQDCTSVKLHLIDKASLTRKRKGDTIAPITTSDAVMTTVPKQPQNPPSPVPEYGENNSFQRTTVLRDIPAALQALLYHCALPLVCLTPEDYRQRSAAVRTLATAMASMVRVTPETMFHRRRSSSLTKSNSESNSLEKDNREEDSSAISPTRDVSFKVRHAALVSLHTLMTHITAEELTELNQHFASRDRKRYNEAITEECADPSSTDYVNGAIVDLQLQKQQMQRTGVSFGEKSDDVSVLTVSPQSDSASSVDRVFRLTGLQLKTFQKLPHGYRIKNNTGPLSVYNDAVAVDVLSPLVERWNDILRRCVPPNGLFDSGRHLFRHPATIDAPCAHVTKEVEEDGKMSMVIVAPCSGKKNGPSLIESVDGSAVIATRARISEEEAEEIYLLLRVCLRLSVYKHHAGYLVKMREGSSATSVGLAVLLCLTIARCTKGDRSLSLCVECLWNLLEVVPQETVRSILQHVVSKDNKWDLFTPAHQKENTGQIVGSLSSLSATESLLQGFVQIILSGHSVRQRELRNDMVVLLLLILNNSTMDIRNQEKALIEASDVVPPSSLPKSTVNAINSIALTVFDLVCGPELRTIGSTAKMTRRPVEEFVRYHTVMSPTTRAENMQFKLLGWRLLESFHNWQTARLALKNLYRRRMQQTQTSPSTAVVANDSNTDSGSYVDNGDSDDDVLPFDVCHCGFIEVLLFYIDTTCGDELVVAWTREELLTLQEEAWRLLLSLMESTAPLPDSVSTVKQQRYELSSRERTTATTITTLSNSVGGVPNMHMDMFGPVPLSSADSVFVAADGVGCALRYIQHTTTADAEIMVSLAVCVLSVISRTPSHLCTILASETKSLGPLSSQGESTPLLFTVAIKLVQSYLGRSLRGENALSKTPNATTTTTAAISGKYKAAKIQMPSRKEVVPNTIDSSRQSTSSSHPQEGKKTEGEEQPHEFYATTSVPTESEKLWYSQLRNVKIENYSITAHSLEVIIHCLVLMCNIAEGGPPTVVTVQQSFLSMGGIPLVLLLLQITLSRLVSSLASSVSQVNKWNGKLLCAVLHCVRVLIIGNEAAEEQFVQEDGIHVLLSLVDFFTKSSVNVNVTKEIDCNTNGNANLTLLLSVLADLLYESAQAREAFLQWSCFESYKMRDMEDDGCLNATQLLLRLWQGEPIAVPTWGEMCATRGGSQHTHSDAHGVQQAKEASGDVRHDEGDVPLTSTGTVEEKPREISVNSSKGNVHKAGEVPIFRADWWGLQLLGLHGRGSTIKELQNRFTELRKCELMTEGTVAPDLMKQEAQKRLADTICRTLGLHVKIYACLAAVGFERLAEVKATALERVKLLHVAALPSICRDEVWAAIAETVDLRSHAWIVPAAGSDSDRKSPDSTNGDGLKQFVVAPILPDADQLVKVLVDVDARAQELCHLVHVCTNMHTAQEDEDTRRLLLSRLRQGTDDSAVASLVHEVRRANEKISLGGGVGRSVLEHVMDRIPCEQEHLSYSLPHRPPNDMTLSDHTPLSHTTLLQKKRKRDAMIQDSFREHGSKGAEEALARSNIM